MLLAFYLASDRSGGQGRKGDGDGRTDQDLASEQIRLECGTMDSGLAT